VIEQSALGRIAVPPDVPDGFALFWTTLDFDGRLNDAVAQRIAEAVRDRFGIDAALTTCNQVHGTTVRRAPHKSKWTECDSCDALHSDARPSMLGIKVADCLPVSLIDAQNHVIANIHSGWRGAASGVTLATLDALAADSAFDVTAASAWRGPSIRGCCFEVGENVAETIRAAYANAEEFIDRSRKKPHVDLAGLTAMLLQRRGMPADRVHDSGLCTRCDGSIFHSYRRQGPRGGRNLAVVAQR